MAGRTVRKGLSKEERVIFLAALEDARTVKDAAALAGREIRRFYELKERDEEFRLAWERAYEVGADVVRAEVRRRGVDGWDEEVYQQGLKVGTVKRYSDRMLELEAKRRDPAYREHGAQQLPVQIQLVSVLAMAREAEASASQAEVVDGEAVELEP